MAVLKETRQLAEPDPTGYAKSCREAVAIGRGFDTHITVGSRSKVYVCGLGASAIAGDVLQALARKRVISCRSDATRFAHDGTGLVVVISYEGDTKESRACLELAMRLQSRDASRSCMCVTGNLDLAEHARSRGASALVVPPGYARGRKLAYLVLPLVGVLSRLGVLEAPASWDDLYSAVTPSAQECEDAAGIAAKIRGRYPAVYGTDKAAGPAAMMWGLLLREVAGLRTWTGAVPDLLHDEVCTFSDQVTGPMTCAVLLTANAHGRRAAAFSAAWVRELGASGVAVAEVRAWGESQLARLFSLVQVGEQVAEHVAVARGVDPSRAEAVLRSYKRSSC